MEKQPSRLGACYIRVSTEEQAEYSPDSQLREIKEFAARNNILLLNEHIYIDTGISGRKENRPAFQQMIAAAKTKPRPFDVVLVYKYSRFARDRENSIVYKNILRKQCGVSVLSVKEPIDDNDKMSILMESVIEAMDEFYSLNLSEDVRRTQKEKHLRGELQSIPAFGYRVADNKLLPQEDEAPIVREIFSRFIAGEGYYAIARYLNEIGVRTHRGNKFENRTVEYIIRNPVYIGKLRRMPSGKAHRNYDNPQLLIVEGQHQALIDTATWEAAQKRALELKSIWRPYHKPASSRKSWLSGLLYCAACGSKMVSGGAKAGFVCGGYSKGSCSLRNNIRQDIAENFVVKLLQKDLDNPAAINFSLAHDAKKLNSKAVLQGQLDRLNKKINRLRDAYLAGIEDINSYAQAKEALEDKLATIKQQLTAITDPQPATDATQEINTALTQAISVITDPARSIAEKNTAAERIIEKIVYDSRTNTLRLYYRLFLDWLKNCLLIF